MQPLQQDNSQEISNNNPISLKEIPPQISFDNQSLEKPSLYPFLVKSLSCSGSGSVCYSQKHNMIIFDEENTLEFYNATTFAKIKIQEIGHWAMHMSYCDEIDTCLIGCDSGALYSYNVSKDQLTHITECEGWVFRVEFLNSKFYAFLSCESHEISIGNIEDKEIVGSDWLKIDPNGLHCLAQSKLLLTSFEDGSVKIFNTNKLPDLQALCSAQAHQNKKIYGLTSFSLNRKEYMMTSSDDGTLKMWHFIKGRMRLLKVIHTKGKLAVSAVYLENYKMFAVCYEKSHIDFFKLPSWKVEKKFSFEESKYRYGMFLMKDKNMLGYVRDAGFHSKAIDFVQLDHKEGEKKVQTETEIETERKIKKFGSF